MTKELIRKDIIDGCNMGNPLHPANYLCHYIFKETGKVVNLTITQSESLEYWDFFEWCRMKVFEWLNICVIIDREGNELRVC